SDNGGGSTVPASITGTVSDGKRLVFAQINLRDVNGTDRSFFSDGTGKFVLDTKGLLYPLMLQVTRNEGNLYTLVMASDTVANINEATTAIAESALNLNTVAQLDNVFASKVYTRIHADQIALAEARYLTAMHASIPFAKTVMTVSPRLQTYDPQYADAAGDAYGQVLSLALPEVNPQNGQLLVLNRKPAGVGTIQTHLLMSPDHDLATAGLDAAGLVGPVPSVTVLDALNIRKLKTFYSYRAFLDISQTGGYGSLFGPARKVQGTEHLAFVDDGTGKKNVTLMVQIPTTFDPAKPCIVATASAGSDGIYSVVATASEWALQQGCAVAASDKGTGTGAHLLNTGQGFSMDGRVVGAGGATSNVTFQTDMTEQTRTVYKQTYPHRVAFKHAHSKQNPERDWGRNTLDAIKFAFYMLNEQYGSKVPFSDRRTRPFDADNTLVIATGVSNGGGAALAAAEQDKLGLIDGIAVAAPQVQAGDLQGLAIQQGNVTQFNIGKGLLDYVTYANLYQPCAILADSVADAPGKQTIDTATAANRCTALKQQGMLSADNTGAQANEALRKLHQYGWPSDSDALHASHYLTATVAMAVQYANSYGRFGVEDNLCNFSFAWVEPTTGVVKPIPPENTLRIGGIAPTAGIELVYNIILPGEKDRPVLDPVTGQPVIDLTTGKPKTLPNEYNGLQHAKATSPTTGLVDFSFDGALCLRQLAINQTPAGQPLSGDIAEKAKRVQDGIKEIALSGNLQGKPAVIVHGRADALIPVNHSARAYVGKNGIVEGATSKLRYYEVRHAQHFDANLNPANAPGYDTRFIPLQSYTNQALNLVYQHLTSGTPLPDSQLIRTTPRGGSPGTAPAITSSHAPVITPSPAAGDRITLNGKTLHVPE
uniref:3-hydroxybutyrate oligomer hydrolase family protein n=1 Tax=Chitinivorax sp. B TaxID=2502235 RepID=UPI0010F7C53D